MILKITEEQKQTQFDATKEQAEGQMGKGFMPAVKVGGSIAFVVLTLLLVVSVLSKFQDYWSIGLSALVLLIMMQAALKSWDERNKEMTYQKTTTLIYIRNIVVFLIYISFTVRLIWSLFH
jgi:hypothetical protein